MAITLRTLLLALGFAFSATVNANPSMMTGEPESQPAGDCIAWYSAQLHAPPETCNDVVSMHPGLDLATFLKLNPSIHPWCDNMMLGQKVCIATQNCPKPAEPTPPPETSSKQWKTSTTPKARESSSMGSH
ncbi:hypothetical protein N7490_008331 [Penicillium lividum]|nr:hypothetical protein N7490_008331 [Penicillium lividum]